MLGSLLPDLKINGHFRCDNKRRLVMFTARGFPRETRELRDAPPGREAASRTAKKLSNGLEGPEPGLEDSMEEGNINTRIHAKPRCAEKQPKRMKKRKRKNAHSSVRISKDPMRQISSPWPTGPGSFVVPSLRGGGGRGRAGLGEELQSSWLASCSSKLTKDS